MIPTTTSLWLSLLTVLVGVLAIGGTCPSLPKLPVLPGRGWCNLRNKEVGQVQRFKYDNCQTTPDGLFLIPDNAFAIPIDESKIQLYAEIIDSWKNYSSVNAKSININGDASFGSIASISGSFSSDYQRCKQSQVNQKAVTTRVQARYVMYAIGVSVDDNVDPKLLSSLMKVMAALKSGNEEEVDYLLELVVREYGTHILTRVDTGGIINQEEYISRAYSERLESNSEVIKAAASGRFFSMYKFGASYSTTTNTSTTESYEHNLRSSHTESFGGMLLHPDTNISVWIDSIASHPVGVDREGDPLHFIVTPSTFPNESVKNVDRLRIELQSAIARYFNYNKHKGCMDVKAKNFDYNANIDDNMCQDPLNNYTLGGVYQTCQSTGDGPNQCVIKNLEHKNVLTQGFSCPVPYVPIPLLKTTLESCRDCGHWFIFWYISKSCCSPYTVVTYWCAADERPVGNNTGLMFGGLFTSTTDNPITQAKNCPPTFMQAKMFDDLTICIGTDYELGSRFATDFGGFFSCQIGNPMYNSKDLKRLMSEREKLLTSIPDLSNQTTKACPPGYTQHTAQIINDCLVNYCVKAGSFSIHGEMPVILPPFKNYTGIFSNVQTQTSDPGSSSGSSLLWLFVGIGISTGVVVIVIVVFVVRRRRNINLENPCADNEGLLLGHENHGQDEIEENA